MKNLLPLAWFIRSLLNRECPSNYEEFTHIQSDQSMILIFEFFLTSCFFNSLEFFQFSNGESSSVGTICLEVSITMEFEALVALRPLFDSLAIPLPFSTALMGVGVVLTLL